MLRSNGRGFVCEQQGDSLMHRYFVSVLTLKNWGFPCEEIEAESLVQGRSAF